MKLLQNAHEREVATCHETVRILKQRLNEREELFANQKRRKLPVDYYALKAKVCPSYCPFDGGIGIDDIGRGGRGREGGGKEGRGEVEDMQMTLIQNQMNTTVQVQRGGELSHAKKFYLIDLNLLIFGLLMLYHFRFIGGVLFSPNLFYILLTTMISVLILKFLTVLMQTILF